MISTQASTALVLALFPEGLIPEAEDVRVVLSLGRGKLRRCTMPEDEIVCRDIRVGDTVIVRTQAGGGIEVMRVVLEERPVSMSHPWRRGGRYELLQDLCEEREPLHVQAGGGRMNAVSNDVRAWAKDTLKAASDCKSDAEVLYAFYADWCAENNLIPVRIREFVLELRGMFLALPDGNAFLCRISKERKQ